MAILHYIKPYFDSEQQAMTFMRDLWELVIDAMSRPDGIPQTLLEEKKQLLVEAEVCLVVFC